LTASPPEDDIDAVEDLCQLLRAHTSDSVGEQRASAMIYDTLATESLGNPVALAERSTFPGAPAQVMLLVRGTHTPVAIRLRFR
jgi:hypothetical protein